MKSPRAPDSLWQNFLILLGRVLIGWLYVESGWRHLMGMEAFIASLTRRNVPWATVWGWIGALIEFLGGLALLLGAYTRCAALAILTFVATLIGHRYWEIAEPAARRMQHSHFLKNLAIMGGILLLFVTRGGRFSVDGWRGRR